jgi:hypothetical protein
MTYDLGSLFCWKSVSRLKKEKKLNLHKLTSTFLTSANTSSEISWRASNLNWKTSKISNRAKREKYVRTAKQRGLKLKLYLWD